MAEESASALPEERCDQCTDIHDPTRRDFLRATTVGGLALLMRLPRLSANDAASDQKDDSEDKEFLRLSEAAKEYIRSNLAKNRQAAEIYHEMLPAVAEFAKYASVEPMVFKCMDGRTQTNDHKGIPPTIAKNRRSHGGRTDLGVGNLEFRQTLNHERLTADTDGKSLLIIHAAHRSDLSTGCAAFKQPEDALRPSHTDDSALTYMHDQALRTRFLLQQDASLNEGKHAVLSAMSNTDTGGMQLFSNGAMIFDAEAIMHDQEIMDPSDVFDDAFIRKPIAEEWAHPSIKGKTVKDLIDGEDAPLFRDMRVKIALEAYFMRLIAESADKKLGEGIVNQNVLKALPTESKEFNDQVKNFLTYMTAFNVAYATHYRNLNLRLGKDDTAALRSRVSHGELKLAYSVTGHDLEDRNSLILIKPGSGDEEKAVTIGKAVLLHNLEDLGKKDTLPPIVHINIELTEPIDTWPQYLQVISRMRTKIDVVEHVFGENVRMFTTYSYHEAVPTSDDGVPRVKQFMPLNPIPGNKKILIDSNQDIGKGITKETFDKTTIRAHEKSYTFQDTAEQKAAM